MQTNAQGDVILHIGANISKAKTAISDLANAVGGVFRAFRGQSVSSPQLDKLNLQAEQSLKKIEALKQKIASMRDTQVRTDEFKALNDESIKLDKKAMELESRLANLRARSREWSREYIETESKLSDIRRQLSDIGAQQERLDRTGKSYTTEAAKQPQQFAKANEELRKEQANYEGIRSKIASVSGEGSKVASGVSKTFKNMGSSVVNAFKKVRSHAKSSSNSAADSFGNINSAIKKGIKNIIKYGLGVRSLFILFRKIRSAVVESYKDLAAYSDEVNASVSGAKSALSALKNSIAAAVQPLISAFAPMIATLANKLSGVVQTVGQFFAALTGQDYVYKAVDVQESYADALSDTSDNAKKAAKSLDAYLSPLDDINRYTEAESEANEGTDSYAAPSTKFAKEKIENSFKDIANKVKGYFAEIFKPIRSAWEKHGKGVMDEWYRLIGNVKKLISSVANAFKSVWTNGSGERVVGNILKLWQTILGIINAIIETFTSAWNKDSLGESVIQSFIDKFNRLLEFIRDVADTFRNVWESGVGERIWTNILTIVRNINNIIGGFWGRLKKAWDTNENGKKIWQGILGIVEDITSWLKDLSDITFDWIEDLDLAPMMEVVGKLVEAFGELVKILLDKFKTAYKDVLLPFAKWTIEKGLPALIEWFAGAIKTLAGWIDKLSVQQLLNIGKAIAAIFVAVKAAKIIKSVATYFSGLGKAFSGLWSAISAHPYAAAILAIVAALTALVAAVDAVNKAKWETSDLKKSCDEINEYFDDVSEAADNMKSTIEDVNKSHIEIQADVSQVETLKDRLKEVIKDGIISEKEMPEYETIINLLNKVDGFEEMWNGMDLETIDGEIHINAEDATKALEDFLDKWKLTQWQTALSEDYSSIYSSLRVNKRDVNKMESDALTAKENLLQKIKDTGVGGDWISVGDTSKIFKENWTLEDVDKWYKAYKEGKFNLPVMDDGLKDLASTYDKAVNGLKDYRAENAELTKSMEGNWEAQKFLNGETDNYLGAVYAVESGLISEADALNLLKDTGVTSYSQLKTLADIQMETQLGNDAAERKSKAETANTVEEQNLKMIGSNKKAYGTIKAESEEMKTAVNKNATDAANEAEKSSAGIEKNYVSAFSGIRTKAVELWDKLKETFTDDGSIANSIGNLAIKGMNAIIGGINGAIKAIMDLIKSGFDTLRNWQIFGATPFSWLPEIKGYPQIPEIPALARGAVLPAGKPFLAMLGDQKNGNNLEAPENLIRQIVREETQNRSDQPIIAPVQIDGKTLFEIIIKQGRTHINQTGRNPFETVGGY